MDSNLHKTVLLQEAVSALIKNRSGNYVDCTYGRGGHSEAIAAELNDDGRLLVIDRDQSAIAHATDRFGEDRRVSIAHGSFSGLKSFVAEHNMHPLDGVLLDLGVSSPQLDEAGRGFSFSQEGPLDMRMNQAEGETAAQWLHAASEADITQVLRKYGEERFAKRSYCGNP